MLSRILKLLKGHPVEPLPDDDARLALGALMVRITVEGDAQDEARNSRVDALLARMNGLGPAEAAQMRATCEKIEAEAPATRKFALLIRETVSFEARVEAQEALWHVVLTDGDGKPGEADRAVILRMREALGLAKADCDAAQARAAPL